jgi:hypothetical protein
VLSSSNLSSPKANSSIASYAIETINIDSMSVTSTRVRNEFFASNDVVSLPGTHFETAPKRETAPSLGP